MKRSVTINWIDQEQEYTFKARMSPLYVDDEMLIPIEHGRVIDCGTVLEVSNLPGYQTVRTTEGVFEVIEDVKMTPPVSQEAVMKTINLMHALSSNRQETVDRIVQRRRRAKFQLIHGGKH